MPDTAEVIEWATDKGNVTLDDGRVVGVNRGDELLVVLTEAGECVKFLEHYPRVLH